MESGNEVGEWFSSWWGGSSYSWNGRMTSVPRAGLRGTRPARAAKLKGGTAFALRARDGVDRLQCLLRSGPAAARVARRSEPAPDHPATFAPKPGTLVAHQPGSWRERKVFYRCRLPESEIVPCPPSPAPSSGFLRDALPDLHEKFAATGRVAPLLACQEPGFRLTFGDDMRHEVVEEPLDTGPGFSRHAQQGLVPRFVAPIRNCFHGMAFRCCAGVTTCGEVNLSSPRPKSRRLCVTKCSTPPAIASSKTWSSPASGRLGRHRK